MECTYYFASLNGIAVKQKCDLKDNFTKFFKSSK